MAYLPIRCGEASIPLLPLALVPLDLIDLPDLGLFDFGGTGALDETGLSPANYAVVGGKPLC